MRFLVYRDRSRKWRWTLYASNGRKVADSAEGYNRKSGAIKGALIVKAQAHGGDIAVIEKGEVEIVSPA